jgi:hypothetical protein
MAFFHEGFSMTSCFPTVESDVVVVSICEEKKEKRYLPQLNEKNLKADFLL